jgi:hypothetical protein
MRSKIGTCALLIGLTASLLASPAQASQPETTPYFDYLGGSPVTSGASECGKETSQRKGAWLCLNPSSGVKVRKDAGAQAGTCSLLGCYEYLDNYYVGFTGDGSYGYSGTLLGIVYLYVEDKFAGGRSTSNRFQFESTRGVRTIVATGNRLYFSDAWPQGQEVSGGALRRQWGPYGPYGPGSLITAFGTPGYIVTETTVAWAGIAHEFSWTDPSTAYPGRWYVWWKSPKFQRNSSGQYITANPPILPLEPYGSGWSRY